MPPGCELTRPVPARDTLNRYDVGATGEKVAMAFRASLIAVLQVGSVPLQMPPQPAKVWLAAGVAVSRQAADFWRDRWAGDSFMAIGMQDPVLGAQAMLSLRKLIRACPPPMEVAEAGHFVQEWGAPVAAAALAHFGLPRA